MTKAVPRCALASSITSKTRSAVCRSRLPVGSSASTQAGAVTSARATAPLPLAAAQLARCVLQTVAKTDFPRMACARARASLRSTRLIRSGMATFSSAENSGNKWWN